MSRKISIIIPTLNEQACIEKCLQALQVLRNSGHEIIVVDGGSNDETVKLATLWSDKTIQTDRGRAQQMNAGANDSSGDILLFLHADTLLPDNAATIISQVLQDKDTHWGRFDIKLSGKQRPLRLIEKMMNWRSRITGIATGDQAIFIKRDIFEKTSGYPDIPLMEDISLSKILNTYSPPVCLREYVISSSRRWEKYGILKTVFLMWKLRLAYFIGCNPQQLARRYL